MKRQYLLFLSLLLTLAVSLTGCFQKAPKGFPKTVPLTMTVTSGGAPVADATIVLKPNIKNSWSATGKTDSSGIAEMRTMQGNFIKKGVPAEHYTVTITKMVDVSSKVTVINDGTPAGAAAYAEEVERLRAENPSEVPDFFGTIETSPLEIDISNTTKEYKIELNDYAG